MPPSSSAMELKVLISILQSGTTLQTMVNQVKTLSQALTALQAKAAAGGTTPPIPPVDSTLKGVPKEVDKATDAVKTLEGAIHSVTRAAKFLAGGFLALESVRFLKELADTAARTEVLGTVLHVVAVNAGYTADQIDAVDKKVQSLGITAQASRQSLTQFLQARLKLEYAPQLARAAQDLAVIEGSDSSATFERLISSIQRLNTISLRSMGITVDRSQAEQKFREKIGATTRALTEQEKQEALTQEVLAKAALLQGTYESAMGNAAKQLTSLTRLTQTYKETLGNSLLPAYSAIIAQITTMFDKLIIAAEEFSENKERAQALADTMNSLAETLGNVAVFLMNHLDSIIMLAKLYLEVKVALLFLNAAAKGLGWMIIAVDWATKARIAWTAWQMTTGSFTLALKILGATSVTEAAKILSVAEAEAAVAAAALPAVAGIEAVGAAAAVTTAEVGALSLAWGSLGLLMAIPIVGYIIYKVKAMADEEAKRPVLERIGDTREGLFGGAPLTVAMIRTRPLRTQFEEWKRMNAAVLSGITDETALVAELNRQLGEFSEKQGLSEEVKKLGEARAELKAATTERQQLLNEENAKPTAAELDAAQARITAAGKAVQALQEETSKAFEATIKTTSAEELQNQVAKVQALKRELSKTSADPTASRLDLENANAAVEVESARLSVMKKVHAERLETKGITDPDRLADSKAQAQAAKELLNTTDAANRLTEAKKNLVGSKFEFTDEGLASGEFGKTLGGYEEVLKQAKEVFERDGKIPLDMADALKKGMEELGQQAKTPLDFTNLQKQVTAVADLEKAVPGIRRLGAQATSLARLGVRDEVYRANEPNVAERRRLITASADTEIQISQEKLARLKTQNAVYNAELEDQNKQQLVGLNEYFDTKLARMQAEHEAEVDLENQKIEKLRRLQATENDPQRAKAFDVQIAQAREARRVVAAAGESEETDLETKRQDRLRALRLDVQAQLLEQGVLYGGEEQAIKQLNFQLEQEAKKLAEMKGTTEEADAERLLALHRLNGEAEIHKKTREQTYQLELSLLQVAQDQLNLKQQARDVEAAQDRAAVSAGAMTSTEAMQRNNARVQAAQEDNRENRRIEGQKLLKQEAKFKADLTALEVEAATNPAQSKEETDRRRLVLQQAHTKEVNETTAAIYGLDVAYVDLGETLQLYGKQLKEAMVDSFADAMTQSIVHFREAGKTWINLATSIQEQIIGIFAKAFSEKLFQRLGVFNLADRLMNKLFGGGGGVGGAGMPGLPGGMAGFFAEGGMVSGPGTGTSDSIIARVSAGEHIMPAAKAATWMPVLEGIRTGKILPFSTGGVVQSIALSSVIPRRYASGGVVVSDGGASAVTPGGGAGGNMVVSLHPDALNMTMREWLEHEVVRQHGRR